MAGARPAWLAPIDPVDYQAERNNRILKLVYNGLTLSGKTTPHPHPVRIDARGHFGIGKGHGMARHGAT